MEQRPLVEAREPAGLGPIRLLYVPSADEEIDPFNVPPSGALFCNPASVCMVIFKQRQLSQQLSRLDGIP